MLKLKLQYFRHLMQRLDSFEKTLMLGKIESRRRRGQQRMRWLDSITGSVDMGLSGLQELMVDRESWRAVVRGVTKSQTWLSDWTELNSLNSILFEWNAVFFGKPHGLYHNCAYISSNITSLHAFFCHKAEIWASRIWKIPLQFFFSFWDCLMPLSSNHDCCDLVSY